MSDNSERESQSSPSPHAFSGEEFESGSHNEDMGTDGESTGSECVVEGLIAEGNRVGGGEQSRSSGGEAYREMQRNYVTLEACANRVLGITQAPEASASGRAGPSGCGTVVVASADVGVPIGVPLPKKNMMSLYDLESLKVDYAIPDCVGLRLPIPTEAARYPPEGCVMVFSAMYKHGLRLPLHPWVQMMLSRLGYAPGVQATWQLWLGAGQLLKGEGERILYRATTIVAEDVAKSVVLCLWPMSREEEEEIELVRRQVPQEACELKNIVTPALLLQSGLLQGMAEVPKKVVTVVESSPKVVVDPEERQRKLQERREKDRANRAKKQAKGAPSTAKGTAARAAGKRPRMEEDELLTELEKKRRGLESSIHDVMGGTVLPPFDLDPPPRLPLEMEELFLTGTEDIDFASVR
ncbi:unnamed protein product [Prunus armeniaca]